jgi:hypothetical protein
MKLDMNSYSTIAWVASAHKGKSPDVHYGLRATTTPGKVFGFFGALGDVAFAYAGHNVVLEIQATIPSTPERPSKKPMWKGAVVAYVIVAACYFPASLVGYWAFRQPSPRQRPHQPQQTKVAHRPRQHDGCRSRHWQLPGMYVYILLDI